MSANGTWEFTPTDTGRMNDFAPDLPTGAWVAVCELTKTKTKDEGRAMLVLEWKTIEALTEGNTPGKSAKDFITFLPASHPKCDQNKKKVLALCEALNIEPPTFTSLQSEADLAEFVTELQGAKLKIWTKVTEGAQGKKYVNIYYTPPRGSASVGDSDDDFTPAKKLNNGKHATV